jgi:hypothetical protein
VQDRGHSLRPARKTARLDHRIEIVQQILGEGNADPAYRALSASFGLLWRSCRRIKAHERGSFAQLQKRCPFLARFLFPYNDVLRIL